MTNELWTTSLNVSSQCEYLAVCQCLWENLVDGRWHHLKWTTMCWQGLKWLFLVIPLRELWRQSQHLWLTHCVPLLRQKQSICMCSESYCFLQCLTALVTSNLKATCFASGLLIGFFPLWEQRGMRIALHSYAIYDLEAFESFLRGDWREVMCFAAVGFKHSWGTRNVAKMYWNAYIFTPP